MIEKNIDQDESIWIRLDTPYLYKSKDQACLIGLPLNKFLDADFLIEWNSCAHSNFFQNDVEDDKFNKIRSR